MVITIDGPAGVGKSTVSARLAERLGIHLLDTGAMYRTITFAAQKAGIDLANADQLADFAYTCRIEIRPDQSEAEQIDKANLLLNGVPVGPEIRDQKVTVDVHYVADNLLIRKYLVSLQRQIGLGRNIVAEGRDQGTVVFPNANCKIFLTASDEVRALRRVTQLSRKGVAANFSEILEQQIVRDKQDQSRPVGKLMKALDAVAINTDKLSEDQVLDRLCEIAKKRWQIQTEKKQAGGAKPACC